MTNNDEKESKKMRLQEVTGFFIRQSHIFIHIFQIIGRRIEVEEKLMKETRKFHPSFQHHVPGSQPHYILLGLQP